MKLSQPWSRGGAKRPFRWPLNDEKIYIIPTRTGMLFALCSMIVFLAAAGYGNNLIYLLFFAQLAIFIAAMVQTHTNIVGIQFKSVEIEPGPAEGESVCHIWLQNANRERRVGLEAVVYDGKAARGQSLGFAVEGKATSAASATIKHAARGIYRIDRVKVSTTFPLGLFYAWKLASTKAEYYVYPARRGELPLPEPVVGQDGDGSLAGDGGDDFREHRPFHQGDSYRHVDWKALAKGHDLLIKQFGGEARGIWWLDWHQLQAQPNDEDKLSQLTEWLFALEASGGRFGLRLPSVNIAPGGGEHHLSRCLKVLADFDGADRPSDQRGERVFAPGRRA